MAAARRVLAKATNVSAVKRLRDQAEAVRQYVRQQGESLTAQNQAAEIKLRDKENAYHHGIKQFIDDKTYKPTFEAYDREKAARD